MTAETYQELSNKISNLDLDDLRSVRGFARHCEGLKAFRTARYIFNILLNNCKIDLSMVSRCLDQDFRGKS